MRLAKLPAWIVRDDDSVEAEVASYRDLDLSEKWRLVQRATRGALALTRLRPDGLRLWEIPVEPLPASTVEALRRMRIRP